MKKFLFALAATLVVCGAGLATSAEAETARRGDRSTLHDATQPSVREGLLATRRTFGDQALQDQLRAALSTLRTNGPAVQAAVLSTTSESLHRITLDGIGIGARNGLSFRAIALDGPEQAPAGVVALEQDREAAAPPVIRFEARRNKLQMRPIAFIETAESR